MFLVLQPSLVLNFAFTTWIISPHESWVASHRIRSQRYTPLLEKCNRKLRYWIPSSQNCYLIMVEGFEYPHDPRSYVVRSTLTLPLQPLWLRRRYQEQTLFTIDLNDSFRQGSVYPARRVTRVHPWARSGEEAHWWVPGGRTSAHGQGDRVRPQGGPPLTGGVISVAMWIGSQSKAGALAIQSSVAETGSWNMEWPQSGGERAWTCEWSRGIPARYSIVGLTSTLSLDKINSCVPRRWRDPITPG